MSRPRGGFTLVELMVVIAILLLSTYVTMATISRKSPRDKMVESARQVQSAILGARDRAVHAGKGARAGEIPRRGVRLLMDAPQDPDDPNEHRTVSGMVFVRSVEDWASGSVWIGYADMDGNVKPGYGDPDDDGDFLAGTIAGPPTYDEDWVRTLRSPDPATTQWLRLYDQGMLVNGARIKIPNDSTGSVYRIDTTRLAARQEILTLTTEYRTTPVINFETARTDHTHEAFKTPLTYSLEMSAVVLPGQEPMLLASGVVIDLHRSQGLASSSTLDIMFSPRGTIYGPLAAKGIIHLYLCEMEDSTWTNPDPLVFDPTDPANSEREKRIVSLFTQSGSVKVSPVDRTDAVNNVNGTNGADKRADNPFRYATTPD